MQRLTGGERNVRIELPPEHGSASEAESERENETEGKKSPARGGVGGVVVFSFVVILFMRNSIGHSFFLHPEERGSKPPRHRWEKFNGKTRGSCVVGIWGRYIHGLGASRILSALRTSTLGSFFFAAPREQLFHLLDGHFFAGLSVHCLHHRSIGPIAELLGERVAIHTMTPREDQGLLSGLTTPNSEQKKKKKRGAPWGHG